MFGIEPNIKIGNKLEDNLLKKTLRVNLFLTLEFIIEIFRNQLRVYEMMIKKYGLLL